MGDQKSGMLRKFLSYYKPQLHLFWMDTFAAIIVAAVDLAFPQILRHLTGGLFTQGADVIRSVIVYLGIGLFAMYVLRFFCRWAGCPGRIGGLISRPLLLTDSLLIPGLGHAGLHFVRVLGRPGDRTAAAGKQGLV